MINVAMLSYWHVHAWDYTQQVQSHPDTQITAVWDENVERGKKVAEQLDVPFYEDINQLLQDETIEAVVVSAPTSMHKEVMIKAAQAGKHIFTEKVIAATLKEVEQIMQAVEDNNVTMVVSLPRLYEGYTKSIVAVMEQNLLGKTTLVRVRLSHNGATANWLPDYFYNLEQCGGGAMIDLGCHPMYLTLLFMGTPKHVQASYTYITKKEVEDNAVAVLTHENGAIGIVEAGFVNSHSPFMIEVHGTEGTIIYNDEQLLIRSNRLAQNSWQEVPVMQNEQSAYVQWVNHLKAGTSDTFNLNMAKKLTLLMEAANESASSGTRVELANRYE